MANIIDALKNFDFTEAATSDNIKISLGNGDNEISVVGDDLTIEAGNGNNTVEVMGDDDSILLGDGNNIITSIGEDNTIIVGKSTSTGSNTINQVGDNAKIITANGNNKIYSYSNNATITSGNGNNTIGSLGNNVNISVLNGNNNIAYWGNKNVIDVGNGNNNIKTLDWLNGGPSATDDNSKEFADVIKLPDTQSLGGMNNDTELMQMASFVNASYTVTSSLLSKTEAGETVAGASDWAYDYFSSGYLFKSRTVNYYTNYLETYKNNMTVNGVEDTTLKVGNGYNDIALTVTNNKYNIQEKDKSTSDNNKIYILTDSDLENTTKTSKSDTKSRKEIDWKSGYYVDPLVIDFNGDGVVSADTDTGVDIDKDGTADIAATNGDKMLAMSDINGNGEIDGAEVFGNNTVDPFTGKALNANNGFDALAKLAESAEKYTGISCIDSDGNVNLADLQKALATKGIKLGFVSDANNSMVEDLEKIVSINVSNYKNNDGNNEKILHAQTGSAIFDDGSKRLVEDIWINK